jgi:hypothetical protein
MFALDKNGTVWTLRYDVSALRKVLTSLAAPLYFAAAIWVTVKDQGFITPSEVLFWAASFCILFGYLVLGIYASTAVKFDLNGRRVSVSCKRPWFGPVRSFDFADVAALEACGDSDDPHDLWVVRLILNDGSRLSLGGVYNQGKRIRALLQEIGCESKIAVRIT